MSERPAGARHIDLRTLPPQRWKNDAGTTREIALGPEGAGFDAFDWRLSVAEVEHDAPFSTFDGVDRCIVLLRGAGMQLVPLDGQAGHRLDRPLRPWAFPGERRLEARLLNGPCTDFNVMTRRGRWQADVRSQHGEARVAGGDVTLLLAVHGRWQVGAALLEPMQGLLWRDPLDAVAVAPRDGAVAPALLHVRLCQHRTA